MAEVAKGIIEIELNTGSAASELKALQAQINAFNVALNKGNKAQGEFSKKYSQDLQASINSTKYLTAETVKLSSAAFTLDKNLSKGKTSLGQFFSAKFNKDSAIAAETMALAAERARRLQTQFIATSGAANGFQEALAVRPLAAFSSETAVAAQRSQILSNMLRQGSTQLVNFGKNVQWAGRQLMVGFTVPLTIFGSVAGKTFMDLEKQAVAFKKVYGDIFTTPAELDKNLEAVKGLASEYTKYGIAVKDTIGLAAQAAAAGRQNADLTDAVSQATRLATLGQMDQNAALETTISLQSAFRLSGKDLADTINFLNMVENQTVVSLQDIAAAIPRVAPVIQGLGGNVKDLTVFLAAMQEGGVDAAEGANALKSGLASLINPTKQATEMLNGMGINLETIIQANRGDLMGTVQAFAQALAGLDQFSRQQALEQVFGKFQYAKLGALFDNISRKGSQAQQVIATMGYSTEQLGATADKELKTIEESFGVQLTGAVERFKLAIAPIGQLFVQLAIPVVNFITKIVDGFNSLTDGQKKFAAIAAVIVGVVVPAVTMLAGLFLNLVGTLTKITQGIALFGKGFITGGPVGAIKALSQSSKYLSLAEMDAAMAAQQLSSATDTLNATLVEQAGSANIAKIAIDKLTASYLNSMKAQGEMSAFGNFSVATASQEKAAKTAGKTNPFTIRTLKRNAGGGVPGVGSTDTVPAMLTPGEFVVNKDATSKNLDLLRAINGGKVNGYNSGGMIPGVQYLNEGDIVQARRYVEYIQNGFGTYEEAMQSNLSEGVKNELKNYFYPTGSKKTGSQSSNVFKVSDLDESRRTIDLTKETLKKKTTFAHMQGPVLGVATSKGDFKGGKPLVFGEDAVEWLEKFYASDPDSFTMQQKQYFEAGKLNNFRGWTAVGNLGFDVSSHLNAGTNEVKDLIRDLNIRKRVGINPYETMLKNIGVTNRLEIIKISEEIHKEVINELKSMMNSGKTTYVDTDLYPSMEKAIPRAIERGIVGTSRDPKIIRKLFEPSVKMSAIRARGFSFDDIDEAIKSGRLSPDDVDEYISQSSKTGRMTKKRRISLPGFKSTGQFVTASGTGISRQSRVFSSSRQKALDELSKLALAALSKKGIKLLNSGGNVPGSGNKDTVPAMLTPGEFVVNKKATSQNQQLLEMINGGKVTGYENGGLVQGEDGKWRRSNGQFASKSEIDAHLAATSKTKRSAGVVNRIRSVAPTRALSGIGMAASVAGGLSGNMTLMNAGMVASFAPMLKKPAMAAAKALGGLGAPVLAATAGFALAGFAVYKLNKQIQNAEKSGAEFTNAMYGSSKTIEGIAKQFGTQTNAQAARITAVERAGGQEIGQEAQAQSAEFIQSEAGKQMLKDIGTVKAGGGNAVEALRNQLSSAIISGAIGTEEARAIAAEVGTALGDQSIAVGVSGELTKLLGPNGEDMLKNLSSITAEISPKINATKLAADATSAYEKMNIGAKFIQAFQGGEADFIKNYKINEVSATTSAAFAKEAEARELLNLAYQEGTITLEEYLKQSSAIAKSSKENQNTAAQSLGFADQNALATAAEGKAFTPGARGGMATARTEEQKIAYAAIQGQREEIKKQLEEIPEMQGEALDSMMANVDKLGGGLFGELLNGTISFDEIPLTIRLQEDGMSEEDIVSLHQNLNVLQTIPNIDMVVDIDNPDPAEIQALIDEYKAFEQLSDTEKKAYVKTNVSSEELGRFKTSYEEIMKLPDNEIVNVTKMINLEIDYRLEMSSSAKKGDMEDKRLQQGLADNAANYVKSLLDSLKTDNDGSTGPAVGDGAGGGADKQTLQEYLAEFRKLTQEKQKYLQETMKYLGTAKMEAIALIDQQRYLEAIAMTESKSNKVRKQGKKILEELITLAEQQMDIQRATAFLALSAEEKAILSLEMKGKLLDKNAEKENKALRDKQRQVELNDREIQKISEQEEVVNKAYDSRLEALDKVSQANDRIAEQDRSRISLASALASGDIAAAANAASEMQQQEAEYRIEDTRAALEAQRQRDLAPLIAARTTIEEKNKGIQVEIQGIQDALYEIESKRTALAEQRAAAEEKTYLMQQKQTIAALQKQKNLTPEQQNALKVLQEDVAKIENAKNYGGSIKKMAFGGTAYKGSNEPPPALRMNYGSTVPGIGMTDKVPALLTPGEFVVRKSVAKQYGGFLNQLNGQVFPGIGEKNAVPTNNFLDGIGSPRYSIPESSISDIPVNNSSVVSTSSPMYNSTYNVNVNVSGTNASPDDIANVVMAKLSQQNRGNLRSSRY